MLFYVFSFTSGCLIIVPWWSFCTHLVFLIFLATFRDSLSRDFYGSQIWPQLHLNLVHLIVFQVQFTQLQFTFSLLSYLAHLVVFQVLFTQLHSQLTHLVAFLILVHLVRSMVQLIQWHFRSNSLSCILNFSLLSCIIGLIHLISFLIQLTQLYFRFCSLSCILSLGHLGLQSQSSSLRVAF